LSDIQLPEGFSADEPEVYSYDGQTFEPQNTVAENGKLVCYINS